MSEETETLETTDPEDISKMKDMIADALEKIAKDLRDGRILTIELKQSEEGGEVRFEYVDPTDIPATSDIN